MKKIKTIKIVTLFLILITLTSCFGGLFLTEINRCLFIDYKIDLAQKLLAGLDQQMAKSHGYEIFEVNTKIYNFDLGEGAVLKTMISFPKNKTEPCPVVIFSHGLGASAESQLYLTNGLARRGNIVIASDHLDIVNYDHIGLLVEQLKEFKSINVIEALKYVIINIIGAISNNALSQLDELTSLSDEDLQILAENGELLDIFNENFSYRSADNKLLIEKLSSLNESDPILSGRIDLEKLIMAGHSLGGTDTMYQALEVNPFKAFVCLSPATDPFTTEDISLITQPIMYLSGDLDTFYEDVLKTFQDTLSPKVFQSISGGGHTIFADRLFLYGLGIPFISEGEIGFTSDLPYDKDLTELINYYPEQLDCYQAKALTILKGVSAFVDVYTGNEDRGLEILNSMTNDSFISESIIQLN